MLRKSEQFFLQKIFFESSLRYAKLKKNNNIIPLSYHTTIYDIKEKKSNASADVILLSYSK